mgnify:FL=1
MKVNARKEPGLVDTANDTYLELDIYLPSLHLAFEYQVRLPHLFFWIITHLTRKFTKKEKHHYISTGWVYTPLEAIQEKDSKKKEVARMRDIDLVIVPFWWDGSEERCEHQLKCNRSDLIFVLLSLIASIRLVRPDLLLEKPNLGTPISTDAPTRLLEEMQESNIEGIGRPTNACFFTMSAVDPKGW